MKAFLSNQKISFLLRSICFLFLVLIFLNTFVSSTQNLCHSDQRDALLEFKNEFRIQEPTFFYPDIFYYPKTESWVNKSDCCSWDGITCDAKSGKVIGLDLSSSLLLGQLESNSNLFRLRHLRNLNVAYNNFTASSIPADFDKLMGLETLDLSHSFFSGQIPTKLLQLTKLVSLNLSYSFSLSIDESFLHLLAQNLRNLRELHMSYVNISSEIPHEFSNMQSLRSLYLEDCNLFGEFPSSVLLIPSLQSISLGENPNLRGNLPVFRENNSLLELVIHNTTFSGKIPLSLGNLSHLSYLDLSSNNFVGEIPSSIGNLKQLTDFDVSNNMLSGNLPASILNLTQLISLSLSSNQFIGSLPPIISQISKLESFIADDNSFTGTILSSLLKIPSLMEISLTYNHFSDYTGIGNISLLPNLHTFAIQNKNYNEVSLVDLNVFLSLKQLRELYLWGFPLSTANITSDSDFPSHLVYLHLRGCNFTGEIPRSICGLSFLEVLDLSDNNLHGSIPQCLETLMSSLLDLNLRNNSLSGSLPEIFMNAKKLISLDVSHNRMEGKLPVSLTSCSALKVLNVGSNKINDSFPFQLNSLQELQVLVLRSNKFHGTLLNADGVWFGFPQLKIIDVSHNDFLGTLPSYYFMNWTMMSSKRDTNMKPEYIQTPQLNGTVVYYTSLVLMSKGVSMEMERILTIYTSVDFSGNQLHGQIPDSVGLLKDLRILNLSSNAFTGHIPSSLANLTNLESLDLSQNKISGEIPPELGALSSLEWINVSHNHLEGSIPQGTQFQRQKCSSYEGNPGLNGPSLKDVCRDIKAPTPPQPEPLEIKEEEEEESVSWVAAGLGFAPGVVFGLAMGYIVASYNHQWFMKTFDRIKQLSTRTR